MSIPTIVKLYYTLTHNREAFKCGFAIAYHVEMCGCNASIHTLVHCHALQPDQQASYLIFHLRTYNCMYSEDLVST